MLDDFTLSARHVKAKSFEHCARRVVPCSSAAQSRRMTRGMPTTSWTLFWSLDEDYGLRGPDNCSDASDATTKKRTSPRRN